jgi:hypothetical protein
VAALSPTQRGLLRACAFGLVTGACVVGGLWWGLVPKAPPGPHSPPPSPDHIAQVAAYGDYPDHFDHAWVMSWDSRHYMGVALAVRGNEYFYWRYRDPGSCDGPFRGTFHLDGDVLVLEDPRKDTPDDTRQGMAFEPSLYSKVWMIHRDPLGMRLYALSDGIENIGRHLLVDTQFNPKHPFRNHDRLKPKPVTEEEPPIPFQLNDLAGKALGEAASARRGPHKRSFVYPFPMGRSAPRAGMADIPDLSLDADADRNNEIQPPNKPVEGTATGPAVEPESTPPPPHL